MTSPALIPTILLPITIEAYQISYFNPLLTKYGGFILPFHTPGPVSPVQIKSGISTLTPLFIKSSISFFKVLEVLRAFLLEVCIYIKDLLLLDFSGTKNKKGIGYSPSPFIKYLSILYPFLSILPVNTSSSIP